MEQTTTIFLTPIEAEAFKQFQRYHQMFVLMQKHKVFDIQFGSATLNFAAGELQNIRIDNIYKV